MVESEFAFLPGKSASSRLKDAYVALLPIGACEYHGPHAPMGTDFIIAKTLAERIALKLEQSGNPSCVLPTIPFGYSVAHVEYAGTLSLAADTLTLVLRDLFRSLSDTGTQFLMIINGHDGNVPSINIASSEFRIRKKTPLIASCTYWDLTRGDPEIGQLYASDPFQGKGHGGAEETALVAAAYPGSVDPTLATEGKVDSQLLKLLGQPRPFLFHGIEVFLTTSEWAPDGFDGDARVGTREIGERDYELTSNKIIRVIHSIRASRFFHH